MAIATEELILLDWHPSPFEARFRLALAEKGLKGRMLWLSRKNEVKVAIKKDLIKISKTLEEELGGKPYFGGESSGYTDWSLIPLYSLFYTFETLGNFSMAVECPKLVA
ncbi:glutathione s-transferase, putative [Ricinus communis]|uniref:Glutathione s-transferase, putative n=1 Tax=Ricinus communis TaxID=3988 RepID=B9RQQ3_RICCO|nr:glutathione s-transferase, putative [Ricinus communis]